MAIKDFSARQIRSSQLIASGGITNSNAGLIVYSASIDPTLQGAFSGDPNLLSEVGDDVFFFVSGSKNSKIGQSDSGNGQTGVTLFGGDVVVSGTFYAEKMVVEVEESTTGSFHVSGSLFVSGGMSEFRSGLTVNRHQGGEPFDDFIVYGRLRNSDH